FLNDGKDGNNSVWISGEKGKGEFTLELPRVETINRVVWARDRQGVYKDRLISKYRIEVSVSGSWEMLASSEDRLPDDPKEREKTVLLSAAEPVEKQEWEALSTRLADLNR